MTAKQYHPEISRLRRRYQWQRLSETVLFSTSAGLVAYVSISFLEVSPQANGVLSLVLVFLTFLLQTIRLGLFTITDHRITAYLNQFYPILRDSADLLICGDQDLSILQQLQKSETNKTIRLLSPTVRLPNQLLSAGLLFLFSVGLLIASSFIPHVDSHPSISPGTEMTEAILALDTTRSQLSNPDVQIMPPVYTGQAAFTSKSPNVEFPEGSSVRWSIRTTGQIDQVHLILSGRDSLKMNPTPGGYRVEKTLHESGFYQLHWKDAQGSHLSDFYELTSRADQGPTLTIPNLQQFTQLTLHDRMMVSLETNILDDYGITQADVVATVSKGSGESVKFREEKLRFTSPVTIQGKNIHASLTFDLLKLGLEPGDELYFYAQAWDNKSPQPNYNRTETFFIALQDTAQAIVNADAGLGVDLMPEYFRSQRQIIIDTEKLLRDKNKMKRTEFNSTSNELGYDQKVLRLRYGQFLGEEAEAGIGVESALPADSEKEESDPVKKYGHTHDRENEHNLVQPKNEHSHEGAKDPNEQEDPMKAFLHVHDNEEEATFFVLSVKAKLKAALTLMWDAELYLRLYEPAKSLPYQYKILNLLKEISNDSRIYVHRTGFDPPPLKEDRRLTGDLTELRNSISPYFQQNFNTNPGIRNALKITEQLISEKDTVLSPADQVAFRSAGQEVAELALLQPGRHLQTLTLLQSVTEQDGHTINLVAILPKIRVALWSILPKDARSPSLKQIQRHPLDQTFLKSLEKLTNE